MNQLAMVFKLDWKGFNLVRGVLLLAVMLATLAVLHAADQEKYFLTVALAELFAGISDPGGEYGYRMSHLAVFGVAGTLLTALGFGIGGDAWGWVVLAAALVTLLGGLTVRFGLHRFIAALLLNIWFVIALSVQAGYSQEHVHVNPWAEALAWLIGSAVTLAYLTVLWLARGRKTQAQPVADLFPGDTKPIPLTRPVILFAVIRAVAVALAAGIAFGLHQANADWMPVSTIAAMKPSLEQSALAAEQRLAGTIVGAVVAAVFLLAVDTKIALEAVIAVLGALAVAIRGVSYAWYCAAVVTLLGGLAVRFGMHRFVASLLLNIWFVIVLSVQAGYSQEHVHVNPWAEALAWLIGSAVTLAVLNVLWLARGRTAQAQPVADLFPGDTKPVPLTRPVILFAVIRAVAVALAAGIAFGLHQPNADWMPVSAIAAMKPSLEQSALAAEQRLAGTIVGAVVAAVFLLAVDTKIVLEAVIVVLGALAGAIRGVSYAWYCAAVAGAVLIGLDLPHPSNLADEGRRVLFTFVGVGIAVIVMFLASQLAKRTASTAQPQPAAQAGASG